MFIARLSAFRILTRMANLYFYAAHQDIIEVLNFVFAKTDCRVLESYSEPGCELREFKTTEQLVSAFALGSHLYDRRDSITLQLWSPSTSSQTKIKCITLDPKHCSGHTFRYCVEGWGLMQLYFGGIRNREIASSHLRHNNEKRANAWEDTCRDEMGSVDNWDWDGVRKLSGKIQYHIGNRLAVSKAGSRPVLLAASKLCSEGYTLEN